MSDRPARRSRPRMLTVGAFIIDPRGRLEILVNNAGLNILDRNRNKLIPVGIDALVRGNLSCVDLLRDSSAVTEKADLPKRDMQFRFDI